MTLIPHPYGLMQASSPFVIEEWFLVNAPTGPSGSNFIYYCSNTGSSISQIASMAYPAAGVSWVTSDGTFLLCVGATGNTYIAIYEWNGSTGFNLVASTNSGDVVANGGLSNKDIAGKIICPSTDTRSTSLFTYLTESPFTITQYEVATGDWISGVVMDFRHGATAGTNKYGSIYGVGTQSLNSESSQLFSLSGTTLTVIAESVANAGWYSSEQQVGWERDEHWVVSVTSLSGSSTLYKWDLDLDAPSIAARVTLSGISGSAAHTVAACNGYVITSELDTSYYIRSYSVSGTSLTFIDEIALTGTAGGGNASFYVSPYTNYLYFMATASGQSKCIKVGNDGSLTTISGMINISNTSGAARGRWAFMDAALQSA